MELNRTGEGAVGVGAALPLGDAVGEVAGTPHSVRYGSEAQQQHSHRVTVQPGEETEMEISKRSVLTRRTASGCWRTASWRPGSRR